MRFNLIDRIDGWESGKSLKASKFLALGEEYLADHFPRFPVMPGVLMLQACVEAAAWLWRATTDFRHPVIVLRDVKSVKYGTFMQPGRRMDVTVELTKARRRHRDVQGQGRERRRRANGRSPVHPSRVRTGDSRTGRCRGRREIARTLEGPLGAADGQLRAEDSCDLNEAAWQDGHTR